MGRHITLHIYCLLFAMTMIWSHAILEFKKKNYKHSVTWTLPFVSLKALRTYIFAVIYFDSLYWNFLWLFLFVSCSFKNNCVGYYFVWLFPPYFLISQLSFSEDSYCFLHRFETKRPFFLLLSIFCCCSRWLNVVNDIILPISLSFTHLMRVPRVKYDMIWKFNSFNFTTCSCMETQLG